MYIIKTWWFQAFQFEQTTICPFVVVVVIASTWKCLLQTKRKRENTKIEKVLNPRGNKRFFVALQASQSQQIRITSIYFHIVGFQC